MNKQRSRPNSSPASAAVPRWRALRAAALVAAATLLLASCGTDEATSGGGALGTSATEATEEASEARGLGTPITAVPTAPYVESDEVGEVPDLPRRIGFANLGPAEVFTTWGDGMQSTAESLGLDYITASAEFDAVTNVEQIRSFATRGVGGLAVIDLDVPSQRPVVCEVMQTGAAVFTVSFGPSTTQLMADQYATGQAAAEAMVQYIEANFAGQGNVFLFNQDDKEGIRPRGEAIRDVIDAAGDGIRIVVDQLTQEETQEYGFEAMNTVLQSNPEVNAVIGPDDAVLGALAALEASGADQTEYIIAGINGSDQALDAVTDPESAFRIDVAYGLAPVGVIPARFTQYWLEGRAIPQVIQFTPLVLNSAEAVEEFRADMADPESIFGSPKQEKYFTMLGSISYETRGAYYDGTGPTPHGDDVEDCDLTQ